MLRIKFSLYVLILLSLLLSSCLQSNSFDTSTQSNVSALLYPGYLYDDETETTVTDSGAYVCLEYAKIDSPQFTLPQYFKGQLKINYLGDHSFAQNKTIVDLHIPDGYEEIGHFAFLECPNLESVSLGKDVKKIGDLAFSGSPKLSNFYVSRDNPYLYEKDGCVIERNSHKLVASNGNIPEGVKEIAYCVFAGNKNITEIRIPEGVESIMGLAFDRSSVTSVFLPDSVNEIDTAAFSSCFELKEIYIPASVETIGARAFYDTNGIVINCEAESKPAGWDEKWLDNCTDYTINWGVTREG